MTRRLSDALRRVRREMSHPGFATTLAAVLATVAYWDGAVRGHWVSGVFLLGSAIVTALNAIAHAMLRKGEP